ncbi:rhodanese-like domain-containing protein [Candidatus Nitrosotalea sp. TS]|uniref:rhodanese-like domain-containing protein n=1 Tax=Candidatus Nitrosotalea sp. TS TaxID=2341020 RepID=UPI0021074590|nr:rhodanese-like domain-containing protein [Candidatus Nitrosotalea sp. TS]
MSKEKITRITVDADTLRSEVRDKSVKVLDIRKEEDYKQGHVPGAINFPLASLLTDDSPEKILQYMTSLLVLVMKPLLLYMTTHLAP